MRKIFLISIVALLLIMSGCSGKPPQNQNAGPQASQQRVFTLDELKQYNGQNGTPAYVAVNGVVYDVSKSRKWKDGVHSACSNSTYAGADYSELIKSAPHGVNVMKLYPVVGTLKQ